MARRRVWIAVDPALTEDFRQFFRRQFADQFHVIGTSATLSDVIQRLAEHQPEVALIDRDLDPTERLTPERLYQIRQAAPTTKVLLLLGMEDEEGRALANAAINNGIYHWVFYQEDGSLHTADLAVLLFRDRTYADVAAFHQAPAEGREPAPTAGPPAVAPEAGTRRRRLPLLWPKVTLPRPRSPEHSPAPVAPPPVGGTIAVWAPWPGAGATTIAANLWVLAAQAKERPVGIDLQLTAPTLDLRLNASAAPGIDVCVGQEWLTEAWLSEQFAAIRNNSGYLLAGPRVARPVRITEEHVALALRAARTLSRWIIADLDTHPHSPGCFEGLMHAHVIIVAVTPDPASLRQATRYVHWAIRLGVPAERFRVVLNQAQRHASVVRHLQDVETYAEETQVPLRGLAEIPFDPPAYLRAAEDKEPVAVREAAQGPWHQLWDAVVATLADRAQHEGAE